MKLEEELFIIRKSGEVLVHVNLNDLSFNPDNLLFGSFLSAILDFAKNSFGSGIKSIDLQNKHVSIYTDDEYDIILALVSRGAKEKLVKKHLEEISKDLMTTYNKDTFKNFDGDLSIFDSFTKKLKEKYHTKLDRFLDDF